MSVVDVKALCQECFPTKLIYFVVIWTGYRVEEKLKIVRILERFHLTIKQNRLNLIIPPTLQSLEFIDRNINMHNLRSRSQLAE